MDEGLDVDEVFAYLMGCSFFQVLEAFDRARSEVSLFSELLQVSSDIENVLVGIDFHNAEEGGRRNYLKQFGVVFLEGKELVFKAVSVVVVELDKVVGLD